jgi:hypothetical protein
MGATLNSDASTKSWALWLAATVATFAALEAHAVSSRRIPTLSHCLRVWLGVAPAKRHRWFTSLAFAGFWTWLVGHCLLGWPPNLKEPGGTP